MLTKTLLNRMEKFKSFVFPKFRDRKWSMRKTSTDGVFRCAKRNSMILLFKGLDIGHVYISVNKVLI